MESKQNKSENKKKLWNGEDFMRIISVTSGKGGVGKSNIVLNLGIAIRKMGLRVLILDGDFGLANIDILMNLNINATLFDVLKKDKSIDEIIYKSKYGIDIIPSSSGMLSMTNLSIHEKAQFLNCMKELECKYDVLLMDTGAGINSDMIYLNTSADDIFVVTTGEPTSITDAYAVIKILHKEYKIKKVNLLVNQVRDDNEGLAIYNRIHEVSDRFLNVRIDYLGSVRWDSNVVDSVKTSHPFLSKYPNGMASLNCKEIARKVYRTQHENNFHLSKKCFWSALVDRA